MNLDAATTLLRPGEVAERLRVSKRTVYRLVEKGELKAVHVGDSKSLRVRLSDLADYLT